MTVCADFIAFTTYVDRSKWDWLVTSSVIIDDVDLPSAHQSVMTEIVVIVTPTRENEQHRVWVPAIRADRHIDDDGSWSCGVARQEMTEECHAPCVLLETRSASGHSGNRMESTFCAT